MKIHFGELYKILDNNLTYNVILNIFYVITLLSVVYYTFIHGINQI
jgi:hypothetical protein